MQVLSPARAGRRSIRPKPTIHLIEKPNTSDGDVSDTGHEPYVSDIVVREYEQHVDDHKTLRRVDSNQELSIELREVRAQMEKLERELAAMKEGPFGPKSEFMRSLPQDEREQLLRALSEEGVFSGQEEEVLTIAELDRLSEEDGQQQDTALRRDIGVSLRIPRKDQAYVRQFNKALKAVQNSDGDIQRSLLLWTWYLRCQQQISNFSDIISQDVWERLWQSQTQLKVRPKHIVMLAEDMLAVHEPLTETQWHAYLVALHASGDTATALEVWQKRRDAITSEKRQQPEFLELGVMLFAAIGRPLKAQELALNAIRNGRAAPQILTPVIIAWAKSQGLHNSSKAWACYLKLRNLLGSSVQAETLENISNAFLDARCADLALNVFKDMLLINEGSQHDSQTQYQHASKHLEKVMQDATTEEQINNIGLSALLILPRSLQNRYFFASWIKKLIGGGRIDAAAMVLELMYERGITPDAKPVNGIIGAWLREGSVSSQRKAEKMANAMIDARIELIRTQRFANSSKDVNHQFSRLQDFGHVRRAVFLRKRFPPATIETFSIMLLHHTRRSNLQEAERLTDRMTGPCQIKPNAFIMNHWLYADLRSSRLQDVWTKFKNLTPEIKPDLETFAALWDTGKAYYSAYNRAHSKDFPSVRQIFAEMVKWVDSLSESKASKTKDFTPELYDQIIRCFCLAGDLPGALVAMHGLNHDFDVFPTQNSIRLLCGSTARLLPGETKGRIKRTKSRQKSLLARVADIVDTIESRKKLSLFEGGVAAHTLEEAGSDMARQLKLDVMTEFICMFLQQLQLPTGSYRNDIKLAAETMGVIMDSVDLDISTDTS